MHNCSLQSFLKLGTFWDTNILQRIVATCLRYGEMFNKHLLQIYWIVCGWENFENPLCFDKSLTAMFGVLQSFFFLILLFMFFLQKMVLPVVIV